MSEMTKCSFSFHSQLNLQYILVFVSRYCIYRTNFGNAKWKLQRLCRSGCNAACPSHSIQFIFLVARNGRCDCTIFARRPISSFAHRCRHNFSLSGKFMTKLWRSVEHKYSSWFLSLVQTYADEGHHLNNVIEHVYKSMEDYLKDCLSLDPDTTKNDGLARH